MAEEQREVLRAQLRSKGTKNPADMELYELSQLSGITMDPHVFEILLDLLRKNVPPVTIVEMLRSMCIPAYQRLHQSDSSQHTTSSLLTSSSSISATLGSLGSSTLSTSGAVRGDHRMGSSSDIQIRSKQDRSTASAGTNSRRVEPNLARGIQSAGSRRFPHHDPSNK